MSAKDLEMIKTYPVTGMSCANCALNVEKTLNRQAGVKKAIVNYADASALIEFEPGTTNPSALKSAIRAIGYDLLVDETLTGLKEEDQQKYFRELKIRTIGAAIFSLPVLVLSMFFYHLPYANLLMMILTIPVVFWFGRAFFINSFRLGRHKQANMDTLVSLSTGIAFLFSVFNTFYPQFWVEKGLQAHVYYEASAIIITFILIGRLLEDLAKSKTSSAIKKLMGLQSNIVTLVTEAGIDVELPIERITQGNRLRLKPGDRIPVDGEIIAGFSSVDESTITGESLPVDKATGDHVFAGTINMNGSFVLLARQVGSETILARIIETVRQAQGSKAPVQKTVDRIAGIFVPVVAGIALLSFTAWMIFGGENALTHALLSMITVLVIACPCALGLATPTAVMVGMGKGAQLGILIRDAGSLEIIRGVNAIVMDKTGTLTEGKPVVTDLWWLAIETDRPELEKILLTLEQHSDHPLAIAVVEYLTGSVVDKVTLEKFENQPGKGVIGHYRNDKYLAGNLKLMKDNMVSLDDPRLSEFSGQDEKVSSMIYFAKNETLTGVVTLADKIKETSVEAVRNIQNKGIEIYMLTGDNLPTAKYVAEKTGIAHFNAHLLPDDKAKFIKDLQSENKIVAMAGDGINDSQAMALANVSIAMGKGSDIAMDVADMTIMSSDLRQIPKAIRLSDITVSTIHQNLFWAFIYNLIGIPIAAGVLYPFWGFMLNPMIAAAAMALSSVSVVGNSLRLRRRKIE
jgi:Cu2+-exporting ATPase